MSRAAGAGYRAAAVKRLTDRGLWRLHDDGWRLHDYLDWNHSAESILERRERRSRAGRAGAASRWGLDT